MKDSAMITCVVVLFLVLFLCVGSGWSNYKTHRMCNQTFKQNIKQDCLNEEDKCVKNLFKPGNACDGSSEEKRCIYEEFEEICGKTCKDAMNSCTEEALKCIPVLEKVQFRHCQGSIGYCKNEPDCNGGQLLNQCCQNEGGDWMKCVKKN